MTDSKNTTTPGVGSGNATASDRETTTPGERRDPATTKATPVVHKDADGKAIPMPKVGVGADLKPQR